MCRDHIPAHAQGNGVARATPFLDELGRRATVPLETPTLLIKTPRASDLAPLLPIFQDYLTTRYTWFAFAQGESRWTEQTLRERFEWQAQEELKGNRRDFVIHLRDAKETVIGRCAIYRPEKLGEWEFGITIFREYWRNGYGEETTRAVLDYAFSALEANDVVLEVLPENAAMQRTCRKMNLRHLLKAEDGAPAGPFNQKYDYFAAERGTWGK